MTVSNFYFNGFNRHIVVVPSSASTPSGFQLQTFSKTNEIEQLVNEISPHLVRDRNALMQGRALVLQAGLNASLNRKQIVTKLNEAISRNLLRVYVEIPKANIQTSTETASLGNSSSKSKAPVSSKGKQTAQSTESGTIANTTPTEVPIDQQECRSDPVSMLSGEEILPLTDFEINGLMPLTWRRLYRSSKVDRNVGLGFGWRHNFSLQLNRQYQAPPKVGPKKPGKYWFELTDEEGRVHVFDEVKRGQTSIQSTTGWSLVHQADGRQVLLKPDDSHWAFKKRQVDNQDVWLLETISNHQGQYFQLYYDKQGKLNQITTGPKRGVLLSYNAQGNLLKVASYILNEKGNKQQHPELLASYQYDDHQALIAATDMNGLVERYSYHKPSQTQGAEASTRSNHKTTYLLKARTRASGFSHHFLWDAEDVNAKCIEQWGDNEIYHYHFSYESHPNGMRSRCIDSLGNKETFVHNSQGLLIEHHNANGAVTRHQYDSVGRKIATIDANNNQTQFIYNTSGQIEAIIHADGGVTQFEYNRLGQCILTQDPIGRTFTKQFDATGRILSESHFDGRQRYFQYNDFGQVTQKTELDGVIHRYHWDRDGELLATQIGDALTRYSHDRLGRVNATINPQGLVTEYIRDLNGQIIVEKAYPQDKPEQAIITQYQFDQAGRKISQKLLADEAVVDENASDLNNANQSDIETLLSYDGLAQPCQQTFADGSWLKFFYDKERNLNKIERSDGAQYRIEYTPTEQPKKLIGFDGREQVYQYDANDKLVAVNDSDIRFIELKRDALGRIIQQSSHVKLDANVHSATLNTQNFYQYDVIGNITRAHNQHRTLEQKYDTKGRVTQVNQGAWHLSYQYDAKGNRSGLTLPDGSQVNYQYNRNGLLADIGVVLTDNQQTIDIAQYQYTDAGLLEHTRLGNQLELTHTYDAYSRLTKQQWQHAKFAESESESAATTVSSSPLFEHRRYHYDNQHQLKASESQLNCNGLQDENDLNVDLTQFEYNKISQLVSHSRENEPKALSANGKSGTTSNAIAVKHHHKEQYHWDAFGNPTQHIRPDKSIQDVVVNNDRLMSMAGVDYRYDASGNQISQIGTGNKQQRSFNGLNQLIQINDNGKLTQYEYDALGRRSAKVTEQVRTDFIWDNNQLIGECTLGEYTWYIYQPDTFTPVALIKAGQVYYYHLDQLDTPICLTDANAQTVWRNQLDVFGKAFDTVVESNVARDDEFENSIVNPIRFQGQYFDDESGLHYNRFRYYSPEQARFIHQDPIGLVGGINHYQYAPNHVNWVDPFGLSCKEGIDKTTLDSSPLISDDLKEKLPTIIQLENKPYSVDETMKSNTSGIKGPSIQRETAKTMEEPTSFEECLNRLASARERIIEQGYKAKYSDEELIAKAKGGSVGEARFLISFQAKNDNTNAKLAFQKDDGLVALWATSFDMLENADSDPKIIADLLATGYDPSKDYVLHIVDRGEELTLFGENTFVPTWDKLEEPALKHLDPKYHGAIGSVLNSDYQKQYASHMEDYWKQGYSEFKKKEQRDFIESLEGYKQDEFAARHALRTEFGANSEFTGDGMTKCRHAGNNHGVVETLTLENNPPTIAEMKNVTTIHLTSIKGLK
ncbi:RHS repeat-associated core domain-containing protein [Shewanella japonica]|uniref:RHS repeat-associated core domain-containing protein n=1 Tax=Shewanella japonica TaxID=93973 RepID=UPI0024952278|nr:RHS repeat-associated core domain-containing protein [Shewanella japonica]